MDWGYATIITIRFGRIARKANPARYLRIWERVIVVEPYGLTIKVYTVTVAGESMKLALIISDGQYGTGESLNLELEIESAELPLGDMVIKMQETLYQGLRVLDGLRDKGNADAE